MNISYAYDGQHYSFRGYFTCEEFYKAKGMRDNLDDMRQKGVHKEIFAHFLGEDNPRLPVWDRFISQAIFTVDGQSAVMELRMGKEEMEQFVEDFLNPPAPEETSSEPSIADPFK